MPFGIGRSIYAIPRRFLFAEESRRPPRDKLRRRGERLYLSTDNEALLRVEYEHWLEQVGIAAFGEPLDHGPDQAEVSEEENSEEDAAESPAAEGTQETNAAGLRAVTDGRPQEAPATIHERRRLMAVIAAGGYQEETVKELAGLVLGERLLDRLSRGQVERLAGMIERGAAGAVTNAVLADRVGGAHRQRDGAAAVERIEVWLAGPAAERAA